MREARERERERGEGGREAQGKDCLTLGKQQLLAGAEGQHFALQVLNLFHLPETPKRSAGLE